MKLNPTSLSKVLGDEFGCLNWWPIDKKYHEKNDSDPRFEIIIGAILTQNTAWSNVEKALQNLKSKNMLHIENITKTETRLLTKLIKPSGFFNQKAARLKDSVNQRYSFRFSFMCYRFYASELGAFQMS